MGRRSADVTVLLRRAWMGSAARSARAFGQFAAGLCGGAVLRAAPGPWRGACCRGGRSAAGAWRALPPVRGRDCPQRSESGATLGVPEPSFQQRPRLRAASVPRGLGGARRETWRGCFAGAVAVDTAEGQVPNGHRSHAVPQGVARGPAADVSLRWHWRAAAAGRAGSLCHLGARCPACGRVANVARAVFPQQLSLIHI